MCLITYSLFTNTLFFLQRFTIMAYLFLWSVKRRSTILKCCNRPHHATAALVVVVEVAITKAHAPAAVLTDLTATPVPRIRKIVQNTGIYCFLKNCTYFIIIIIHSLPSVPIHTHKFTNRWQVPIMIFKFICQFFACFYCRLISIAFAGSRIIKLLIFTKIFIVSNYVI